MDNPISSLSLLDNCNLAFDAICALPDAAFYDPVGGGTAAYPTTEFDGWADEFLSDRYATDEQYRRLSEIHETHAERLTERVRGFLGFVRMIECVQQAADHLEPPADIQREFATFLDDADIRAFMNDWYGFTRASNSLIDTGFFEMHKVGTTSFILRCYAEQSEKVERDEELALKCLIPRYVDIRPIAKATAEYRKRMLSIRRAGATNTPHVRSFTGDTADNVRFIAMDFIRGLTLGERSKELLSSFEHENQIEALLKEKDAVAFIRQIVERLTKALASLAKYDQRHLDLSPYNVIIGEDGRVYLIDFGRNYLVDEILRGGPVYERVVMCIAPELIEFPATDDYTCDLYSLGILLLDVITGGGLTQENVDERLMLLWQTAPGLAEVIETLIATEPVRRTAIAPDVPADEAYGVIRDRLLEEFEIATASLGSSGVQRNDWIGRGGGIALTFSDLIMIKPPEVGALFAAAKDLASSTARDASDRARYFKRLGWWSRSYVFVWSLLIGPALALTAADVFVDGGKPQANGFLRFVASSTKLQIGHPQYNIPGRAIAVTTALIAVGYYMNIFAMIDLRKPRLRASAWGNIAPFTTRVLPLAAVCAQGLAIFYDPHLWGYTAGIGGLVVSANNLVWWRLLKSANKNFGRDDRLASRLKEFDRAFGSWWWLMGLYSTGVLVSGVLIQKGIAHDEVIDAVIIAGGINLAKLYVFNTTKDAGRVRANLARVASGVTRRTAKA